MGRDAELSVEGGAQAWEALLLPEGTPEGQRRAVTVEDALVTVGAGAGTGKTWVLSNRYARLLLTSPDLLPRDILTLTYTEAAAGEMKRRIEARVLELMDRPGAPISAARRREVRDGFAEAWISTIHSFASRVIRESGLSLDIDPRAAVISAPQREGFWDDVREAAEFASMGALAAAHTVRGAEGREGRLRRAAAALDRDPLIGAAVGHWKAKGLSDLARDVAELHASLGHGWEQMMDWADSLAAPFFSETPDIPLIRDARAQVRAILRGAWERAWRAWREVFLELGDDIRTKGAQDREKGKAESADALLAACLERWGGAMSREPDEELLRDFYLHVTDKQRLKGANSNLMKAVRAVLGTTLGEWQNEQIDAGFAALSAEPDAPFPAPEGQLWASLLRFCAVSWGLWDAMKRRRGLLSFSDMILHAGETGLPRDGDGVVDGERRAFRHVLVDEFQDTDPLQFDLIEALAARGGRGKGACLFAVGDPKQSIYRFRHADPSLFAGIVARAGTRVELDVSFRTRGPLLERINDLFAHIWRDGLAPEGTGPLSRLRFEPLSPAAAEGSARDEGTAPPFSVLLSVKSGRQVQDARERLARELARRIAAWVREGRTVWDRGEGKLRPLRWGDFAVLARSRTHHDLLERSLAAAGVPSVQDHSRGYLARGEVGDVISLLRAAADPNDDVAVAGWLLSPFSDVAGEDAVRCLRSSPRRGGTEAPGRLIDLIDAALPEASARLRHLSLVGQREGAAGLLSLFDRDRRWLRRYEDRLRTLRNVRRAIAIARGFERDGASSLTACADWMAHALRQGVVMDEPAWRDKGADAVLLSTIHASKGLEYPVTVLFDAASSRRRPASLLPSRMLGAVFTSLPDEMSPTGRAEDVFLRGAAWEKVLAAQGEREEDMRLLYVALTRAQDSLMVCGLLNEDKKGRRSPVKRSWTALILERMAQRGECGEDFSGPYSATLSIEEEGPLAPADPLQPGPPPRPALIPAPGVALAEVSATSFAMFTWCPLAWRRRYRQGLDLRWESPDRDLMMEEGDSMGGSELGSLAHWILARWPSPDGDPEAELERWLADEATLRRLPSYLRDVWRDPEAKDALRGWLLRFAASEAGVALRRALGAGAQREARFRVDAGEGPGRGATLIGAMDAAWEDGGGLWRVLDYKITLARNAPPGLYEAQMDFYALVIHEAALRGGRPCEAVNVELVFLREEGRVERRRVGGGDWDALRSRVLEAARLGASGPYAPALERCAACPWRRGCPGGGVEG